MITDKRMYTLVSVILMENKAKTVNYFLGQILVKQQMIHQKQIIM